MSNEVTVVTLFALMSALVIAGTWFNPLVIFAVAVGAVLFFYPWGDNKDETG